jgi:hypothetical protein
LILLKRKLGEVELETQILINKEKENIRVNARKDTEKEREELCLKLEEIERDKEELRNIQTPILSCISLLSMTLRTQYVEGCRDREDGNAAANYGPRKRAR